MVDVRNKIMTALGIAILALSIGLFLYLLFLLPSQARETANAQRPLVSAARDLPAFHRLTEIDLRVREETDEEKKDREKRGESREDFVKRTLSGFANRTLSGEVKEGEEMSAHMLATPDAAALLQKVVEVGIPANTSTTLGGHLKVGDVVTLAWFPATKSAGQEATDGVLADPKYVENLVVVRVPAGKVPDAPPPVAPAVQNEKQDKTKTATEEATPAPVKREQVAPAAVIVVALPKDQIKDLAAATTSGAKWILTRKSHVSVYTKD